MSALAAMAGGIGLWLLVHAIAQYRFASRVEQAVQIGSLLFTTADRLSAEIPLVGRLLIADAPADAAAMQHVAEARQAFDAMAAQTQAHIAALAGPDASEQVEIIRDVRAGRAAWEDRAEEMLAEPRAARDPGFFERYILGFRHAFDTLDSVLNRGDLAAEREDGLTLDLLDLARQAWLTRVLMADRTGPVIARVDAGQPLDAGLLERIAQADGRLAIRWATIDALGQRLPLVSELAETLMAAHIAAAEFDALHARVVAAGRQGGSYPLAADAYGMRSSVTGKMIVRIRDVALHLALMHAEQTRQAAAVSVAVVAATLLAIGAATLGVLVLLARRIVAPLLAMTRVIGHLAQRDFAVAVPAMSRSDEIGGLAAALETLRQSAIAAERTEKRISHMAHHDALTGLANRVLLQDRMEHAVQLAGRGVACGVMCLDLDRFKAVNDTFGHPTGDRLLIAVAERLRACVRETDLVSRLGGDEFAILLGELAEPDGAGALAQRIIRALSEPYELDNETVSIGTSVGIALAPQDAQSAVSLLKRADTALYRAKAEGRGTFRYFEPEMDERLQARFEMDRDLRTAIQDGQLDLAYQPLYTIEAQHLCACEALLRWRHPVRGMISPAEFIPLAEETGLIVPIGAWVLQHACAEAAQWPASVKIAVNLSAAQFKSKSLVPTVADALARSGLPASRLELEITESILLRDSAETLATLHALRNLGASIALDDFGTGYSSLSYLRSFPFSKIKIDQSFVRDLATGEEALAIVRAIVALGRSLGMVTAAEGVETEAQLAQLRREGCAQVQGYLFSRPVPATVARQLVTQAIALAPAVA